MAMLDEKTVDAQEIFSERINPVRPVSWLCTLDAKKSGVKQTHHIPSTKVNHHELSQL